ncbi:MAG: hypothetical protein EOM21_20875, partial [Gammaproteobacteria bacterium]|nr:hypothetical protein [Gammaproteobacteria bacterium]
MPAITRKTTAAAGHFYEGLSEQAAPSGVFDSAALDSVASDLSAAKLAAPEELSIVLDEAGEESPRILKAILDGARIYTERNGEKPGADQIETAFRMAYSTSEHARQKYSLDSANSLMSDP